MSGLAELQIRPAVMDDRTRIRQLVFSERLDPTSLKWQRFMVAEDTGRVIGIGQVKYYRDCHELGSLVVEPSYRGQGIAGALIHALEATAAFPLYLMCEGHMEAFYNRYNYHAIPWVQTPRTLKLKLLMVLPVRLFGVRVLVMRKDAQFA